MAGTSSGGGVPPGFRFHPTDEELLHFYLKKKISFQKFEMDVIREVDLNKIEPWDLQERCKIGSTPQNEWYFFSHKDRKYPTGSRTNRATSAGFWKATGRDKCIRNTFKKIGMRKTLVFYRGRAPHGQKTDWIMHEYRLEDSDNDPPPNEDGWVVCRVFKKKNLFKIGSNAEGLILPNTNTCESSGSIFTQRDNNNDNTNNHHYLLHPHHAPADLNFSHIPLHYPQLEPHNYKPPLIYDHHPLPTCDHHQPSSMMQVKQFMSNARDDHSCEPAHQSSQPTTLQLRDDHQWDPLVVTTPSHHQDSDPTSINQINQLSLRSEMDFWAYGK